MFKVKFNYSLKLTLSAIVALFFVSINTSLTLWSIGKLKLIHPYTFDAFQFFVILFTILQVLIIIALGMYLIIIFNKSIGAFTVSIAKLAKGSIDIDMPKQTNDEFGKLYLVFSKLVSSLTKKTEICQNIANGVLAADALEFNSDDKLGQAIQEIHHNLYKSIKQADIISQGNYSEDFEKNSEKDELATAFIAMTSSLRHIDKENNLNSWKRNGLAYLASLLQKCEPNELSVAEVSVQHIVKYIKAKTGSLYILDEEGYFTFSKGHIFDAQGQAPLRFLPGEGFVGRCVVEEKVLIISDIPKDYFKIKSSLATTIPRQLIFMPIRYNNKIIAIMEFGVLQPIDSPQLSYVQDTEQHIGFALYAAMTRKNFEQLTTENAELVAKINSLQPPKI